MNAVTDKEIIKKRFCKNFETYNNQAVVQRQIASKLARLLLKNNKIHYERVLEIGCGTGFLTREILNNFLVGEYMLNDLADSVFNEVQQITSSFSFSNFKFFPGDAESVYFEQNIDAVFSASCFQWFNNTESFIFKMSQLLNSNGTIAFSTFGKENFKEIKSILNVGLHYKSLTELKRIVEKSFDIIYAEEWIQTEQFGNPVEVLRHMKLTGVNGLNNRFFGKEMLQQFNEKYRFLYSNNNKSVNLTYHPIIIIAKKR